MRCSIQSKGGSIWHGGTLSFKYSLQCWFEDNDADSTNTYYDSYSTFLNAACGGVSGWCDDSGSWFTEAECIATYADIIAPNDFIFMESFYTDAAGPYEQIHDFDGDSYTETRYWTDLDHWLTGDWYNVQTGTPFAADWPIGAKADIFDRLSATKKALVWAGAGHDWGNAAWCLTNYGPSPGSGELLPAGDISNCTNSDAYCDYSVNCPIWDEDGDFTYDFMDTSTCLNWCDGVGGCVSCQTNPQNTSNCYYNNCLPVDGCHGGNLDGTCYDTVLNMVEEY